MGAPAIKLIILDRDGVINHDSDQFIKSPDEWRAEATLVPTTWWLDWADWIGKRAGRQVPPPPMGNDEHPVLGDAPGTYVLG